MNLKNTIRQLLYEAVKNNLAEGVLLSGGIDSSTLAYFALKSNPCKELLLPTPNKY